MTQDDDDKEASDIDNSEKFDEEVANLCFMTLKNSNKEAEINVTYDELYETFEKLQDEYEKTELDNSF